MESYLWTMRSRSIALTALLVVVVPVHSKPQDPTALWFSVPVPGADQTGANGQSWMGQGEPDDALLTAVTGGGKNLTRLEVDLSDEERSSAAGFWTRKSSSLGMDAVLEGVPGLAFGLQALDLQPKPSLQGDSIRWGVLEPQGGLRLGVAGDILRPLLDKSEWSLGWSVWFPLYSENAGTSIQAGLVHGRDFRLDGTYAWNEPSTPALMERWRHDTLFADTIEWRTRREVWSVRMGGALDDATVLQVWVGHRDLSDPGLEAEPSWRLRGGSWFSGIQGAFTKGRWELLAECRGEAGQTDARMDTVAGSGWLADRTVVEAASEHGLADLRWEARRHLDKPGFSVVLAGTGSWLAVDGHSPEGAYLPMAPGGKSAQSWASTFMGGIRVPFKRLSVEPRIGIMRQDLSGDPPSFWWAFPQGEGVRWVAPWQLEASLASEGMRGRALYRISGEVPLTDAQGYRAGFRHHIELGQEF